MPAVEKSRYIASFRIKPNLSFAGLKYRFTTRDGYELSFQDDMVWISFDSTPHEWRLRLDAARRALKTILAILTLQVEYPFEMEPIQWMEDKPRQNLDEAQYVLGRLGPEFVIQDQPPIVESEFLQKGEIYAHLASHSGFYRYALLDYSLALSIPDEAIIFDARSVEWIEKYFDYLKQSSGPKRNIGKRRIMKDALRLPAKHLRGFFRIANETVIARHPGDPQKIRPPSVEEIRFCVLFNRMVIDRFGSYLWHLHSDILPARWRYPSGEHPPQDLFESKNPELNRTLTKILDGELA